MPTAKELIEAVILSEVHKDVLYDLRAVAEPLDAVVRTIKDSSVEIVVDKSGMDQLIADLEAGDPPYKFKKKSATVVVVTDLDK